jgi:predicted phosphodiesterase
VRTAVLFDVHGNLAALDAVLGETEAAEVDGYAFGGDLALFGPEPAGCVDRLRALGARAVFVQGNTDRYLAERRDDPAVEWTSARLGEVRVDWLATLPTRQELVAHDALVVHATPRGDEELLRPETPDDEVVEMLEGVESRTVLGGHVHLQFRRAVERWTWVNPGSVGLPFDGDQRAAWALLDDGEVELRRTSYDVDRVIAALAASDNPARDVISRRLRDAAP